ncbi:MAG: aldo/keto reductase [Gammaproteobacteria bacterium]|nr:aldo/keto reductase [Gammaproteobacteria bacterium]
MQANEITRRDVLVQAGALLSGIALGGVGTAGAAATSKGAASAPAAAAGRITIGKDLTVNRLGFGAMRITGAGIWGDPPDIDEAKRVLRRAVEIGVNFIDTADSYGPEVSERLIAEALYPYPKGLVIATKGGIVRPGPDKWVRDGRPEHLREACEASLRRLRVERIDLYQLHAIDSAVPLEDSLGEIAKLQKEGKIRHVGVSNFDVDELARGRKVVEIVSVQNRYNVSDRSSDPVLAACERDGLAFIPWSPLSQSPRDSHAGSRAALEQWAAGHKVSFPQAAIAWLLARSPAMLPIPGTSKVEHLEENVAAAALKITPEEMRAIG